MADARKDLRRAAHVEDNDETEVEVGYAELFFDLVFVFAATQLSHALVEHPTPLGVFQTGILFVAVWWAWIGTVWFSNWLDVERSAVRLMLFALMAAGLFLSMSIPRAWGDRGFVFACALVAMQLGRTLFMLWAIRGYDPERFRNYIRILTWSAASAPFWIAGGLVPEPGARAFLWVTALGIDTLGPLASFWTPFLGRSSRAGWKIAGGHMAERCGLFVILALGEFILVTSDTFSGERWKLEALPAFAAALVSSLGMWWIYFNIGAARGRKEIEESDDPSRIGRFAYTYLHIPIIAGIIMAAAADEKVIDKPTGEPLPAALFNLGGTALFLLGNMAFKRTVAPTWPRSHLIGLALLAALAPAAPFITPLAMAAAVAAVLVLVAGWETVSLSRLRRELLEER